MATLEERVAGTEKRLAVLEDEKAIMRTLYQYSHCLDHENAPEKFTDCFTEDAVWWSSVEGRYGGTAGGLRLEGRPALAKWFAERASSQEPAEFRERRQSMKHYNVIPTIHVDGDRATAETLFLAVFGSKDGPYIQAMGRYFDTLARCPDGRWRLKERHLAREGADAAWQTRRIG